MRHLSLLAIAILIAGCKSDHEVDMWSANPASFETPADSIQTGKSGPLVRLQGIDFVNDEFSSSSLIAPTVLSLKHFGAVSADITLDKPAHKISFLLQTRAPEGLHPLADITIVSTKGKYQAYKILEKEKVAYKDAVERAVNLPAGEYRVTVGYHDATDSTKRPPLDIHWIEFLP